jgi:ECF transporter S component (folate family)
MFRIPLPYPKIFLRCGIPQGNCRHCEGGLFMSENHSLSQENTRFLRTRNRTWRDLRRLCRCAVLAALYVLLTMLSIRAGNLRVTFASLPVVVSALLFGPWEAAVTALIGEFLNQMLSYGFTATTPLWLIPPVVRGVIVGLCARRLRETARPLEFHAGRLYAVCVAASFGTTVCNTAVIWLDSVLYHYYTFAYVFGDGLLRVFTGVVTAVCVASVAMPITRLLRRQGLAQPMSGEAARQ